MTSNLRRGNGGGSVGGGDIHTILNRSTTLSLPHHTLRTRARMCTHKHRHARTNTRMLANWDLNTAGPLALGNRRRRGWFLSVMWNSVESEHGGQKMGACSRWRGLHKKKRAAPGISCVWSECEGCVNEQTSGETGKEWTAEEAQQAMEGQNLRSHLTNSSNLVPDSVKHRQPVQVSRKRADVFKLCVICKQDGLHSSCPFEVCLDASEEHQRAKSCNNLKERWQERD